MNRSKSRAIFLLTLFTLAVMATPAYSATITTYSDSPTWLAATTGVITTDTFTGLAPTNSYTMYPSGILENGVEFIGLSGSTGVMDTTLASYYNFGTGDAGFVSAGGTSVQITLPSPVTAFSIDLFTNPAQVTYTVTTLSTPFTVPTFTTSVGPAFFGVTSDTAFSSVNLQVPAGTTYAFFDNFQFGTAQVESPVPEAGTFLLIGTGLLGFAVFRRKARQPR
jgi:PEP-CTERM motif-containing protein